MSQSDDRPQYDGVLLAIYSLVGIIVPMFIGIVYSDWLTGAVLFFLCLTSYMGYRFGLLKMLGLLAASYVVYLVAWPMGQTLDPHIQNQFEMSGLASRAVAIGISAISIFLLVVFVGHFVVGLVYKASERLELLDRILGFLVGVAEGGGLAVLVLGAAVSLAPMCQQRMDIPETGDEDPLVMGITHGVVNLASATKKSLLGGFFRDNNPIEGLPVVNQVENANVVLNDPQAMQELMEHPNIVAMTEQPALKKTIDMVNNDPELQAYFQAGQVDQTSLRQLADHPAFMKIVDETNLMAEMSMMFDQIQPALEEVGRRHRVPVAPSK